MNITTVTDKIKQYILELIDRVSGNSPLINFSKPILTRIVNNNVDKAHKVLELLADKDGNIDTESLMKEMMESVMKSKPFKVHTQVLGDIEVGDNKIVLNIPFMEKNIVFNKEDLENLNGLLKEE